MREITQINFPPEWFGGETWLPAFPEHVLALTHTSGDVCHIVGGVLTDGTNLLALHSERTGRSNFARRSPHSDWALEERTDPEMPDYIRPLWRSVLESQLRSIRAAREAGL